MARSVGCTFYLCWRLGEPEILYWHDLDAGYAGRQPLMAETAVGSGLNAAGQGADEQ